MTEWEKRRLVGGPAVKPGEYVATVVSAMRGTSNAGNSMVTWSLEFPDGECLFHWTVLRRVETGLMAQALGIPLKPLRISDGIGKQCRATVAQTEFGTKVTGVRPL